MISCSFSISYHQVASFRSPQRRVIRNVVEKCLRCGIGIVEAFDLAEVDNLGLKLVKTITETQLNGSIHMESNKGTKFIIKLNKENA